MILGINAQLCSPSSSYRNAGISQYIRHLVTALGQLSDAPETHLFLPGTNLDEFPSCFRVHRSSWKSEHPAVRIAWEQIVLPFLLRKHQLDVLHSPMHVLPGICPVRSVVTVLDLAFMRHPETYPRRQRKYLEFATKRAVRKANAVIAISENTRRDVIEAFKVPESRVLTTPLGVDESFGPAPKVRIEETRRRYGMGEQSLLYVGTLEPRKNIAMLLAAFGQVRTDFEQPCELVLAGGKGWFYDEIFRLVESLGLRNHVRFTGYVRKEDLPVLYSAAAVFVYPSLYEGFGLPPLEAMACGTPVITSNASSLPEVVGDAGIMVDPHDAQALAEAILRVMRDPDLRQEMSEKGIERAKQFSWQQTARLTLQAYHDALGL
ncbi:MAG TPA: glycosyltransferase family 1 protein [Armatimonadota bacterium]|nr:glycosyltransferase family 1 protein [Armatimonadota bacterium]